MAATLAAPALPTGIEFADSLIRVTERLSALMETEVDLLRGNRARDIKALQTDKESLDPPPLNWSTVYFSERRIKDGNETTQTRRDSLQATAG
ncbi:MAG: hypothetical protein O3B37_07135 [Proteobacteria bacterium]|nr:hypothetical protein [Pseudomonadota bacterium]